MIFYSIQGFRYIRIVRQDFGDAYLARKIILSLARMYGIYCVFRLVGLVQIENARDKVMIENHRHDEDLQCENLTLNLVRISWKIWMRTQDLF